jgi:small subunit ribosomal protein S8
MDPIGNLLTSIRNAELAGHTTLTVRFSKLNLAILEILRKTGFIAEFKEITADDKKKDIALTLPEPLERHHYRRLSKPGRRLYVDAGRIPTVLRGLGIVVLSTPEGVMTGKEARKRGIGGEVMFEAY